MMSKKLVNVAVAYLTALSVFVSPLAAYANQAPVKKKSALDSFIEIMDEGRVKDFLTAPDLPKDLVAFKASDPFLDQDPYFLHGQSWSTAGRNTNTESLSESVAAHAVKNQDGTLSLRIGDSAIWTLKQKMSAVYQTDEYIFLTADNEQMFDQKVKADSGEKSQGLFIVRHVDLMARSQGSNAETLQARVPVFFYPTIGTGWTSKQTRIDISRDGSHILASNAKEKLPLVISFTEIDQVSTMQLALMNFAAQTNLVDPAMKEKLVFNFRSKLPPAYPLPPRGSTAGFGATLTGLNLDRPDLSIFKSAGLSLNYDVKRLIAKTARTIFPLAHAEGQAQTPEEILAEKVIRTAAILGTLLISSIYIKQKIFKDKLGQMYPEMVNGKSAGERRTGHIKALFTTFSQTIVAFYQGLFQTPEYSIEYISDRYFHQFAASKNSWVRKFMESTLLFSRNTNQGIVTTFKTLMLGVLAFGGTDTLHVIIQLGWLIPPIITEIAAQLNAVGLTGLAAMTLASLESSEDGGGDNNFVTNEIVRNMVGYAFLGTLHLGQETKAMTVNVMKPQIEAEMRREGLDPKEKTAEFNRRMAAAVDLAFKKRALPDKSSFLFDTASNVSKLAGKVGYKLDKSLVDEEGEVLNSPLEKSRWGLVTPSLNLAVKSLKKQMDQFGSSEKSKKALQMIEEMRKDFHVFTKFATTLDGDTRAAGFRVRQWMTLLTYEGSTETLVKFLPPEWANLDPETAQIAASTLRLSFYQKYLGKNLLSTSKNAPINYKAKAEEAAKDIQEPILKNIVVNMKIREMEAKEKKRLAELSYEPPKHDWLARRQIEKATAITFKKMMQLDAQNPITSEQQATERKELEKKTFAKTLAEQVGINFYENREKHLDPVLNFESDSRKLSIDQFFEKLHNEILPMADKANQTYITEAEGIARQRTEEEMKVNVTPPAVFGNLSYQDRFLKRAFFQEYKKMLANTGINIPISADEEFIEEVESIAAEKTASQLNQVEVKNYVAKLTNQEEKAEFEKQMYGLNYLEAYKKVADSDMDVYASNSLERPGFWQKVRQSKIVRSSKLLTQVFRGAEASTDTMALSLGARAWAERNIPVYSDLKNGVTEMMKTYLSSVTYKYLIAFHVFGITFSYPSYLFFMATFFMGGAINYWLNRFMFNLGLKPMEGVMSKIKYGTVFSYATAIAYIPYMIFNKSVSGFLDKELVSPIKNGALDATNLVLQGGQSLLSCAQALTF